MKLLFILPEFYPHSGAGISTFYIQLIPSLIPYFDKIKVIIGSGYFHKQEEAFIWQGIEVESLKTELYQKYITKFDHLKPFADMHRNVAAAWAMYEQAQSHKTQYDVIECTDFGHGYLPWAINGHQNLIVRLHGSASQIWEYEQNVPNSIESCIDRSIELACYPHLHVSTHSHANIQYWQTVLSHKKDIKYLLPVYQSESNSHSNQIKENIGLVLGRLQGWKGPEELAKCLQESTIEIQVEWYGNEKNHKSGLPWSAYLSQNYNNIFGKKLIYKGAIPHHEVAQKIQQAHFGLVPSSWDMFNFTTLEYMSLGTVVLVSQGAGAVSLIEHGVNGYVVDMNDACSFENTIQTVLSLSNTAYQVIAQHAKETVDHLGSEKHIHEYVAYYKQVAMHKDEIQPIADHFLKSMCSPSHQKAGLEVVLSKTSIKEISQYLKYRIWQKLFA